MKHLRTHPGSLYAAVLALALIAAACGSSATKITSPTSLTRCSVTLSGPSNVPAQGGSGTVSVAAARECSWNASVEGAWLSIKSGAAGQGEGAVEFAAAANPDPATRRGAIVLNEQRVEVTQAAGECVITLAENGASFSPDGGSGRVEVRASSGLCTWTATTNTNWITLRSEANGKGTAPVIFDVASTTGPPRTGVISVAGQRFEVIQSQGCTYGIAPGTFAAPAAGGNGTITVTTTPGCPWTAGSNVSWLTLGQTEGVGPGPVPFTVAPTGSASRTGSAVIAGQTFTVNQEAGCTYAVEPLTHSVAAVGGTVSVAVNSAAGCAWAASSSVSWIRVAGSSSFSGTGVATFTVDPNTADARSQSVAVAGRTVTISQAAGAPAPSCSVTLSQETASLPAGGGSGQVGVSVAAGCAWTAASNVPWIQITSATTGTGPGQVAFTAAASSEGARTGTLTIGGRTFTVNQAAAACSYTLSSSGQSVPAAGGTGTVNVATGGGCSWTAVSNHPWLTVTAGESGTGNGAVSFAAEPETTGIARTGTLSIGGQTFTVTQGASCAFAISPEQRTIDAAGAMMDVAVTTANGCAWTASTGVPWLSVNGPGSGTGNGTVQVAAAENTGAARTGIATIAGRTFTVTQAANACSYKVKPDDISVDEKERSRKIDVNTSAGCSWTAVSNEPWIRIVSGESGTGPGEVSIRILENDGRERRGTLTIAGQTVNVTQHDHD